MKVILLFILVSLPFNCANAQYQKRKYHNREIIIQEDDTLIKTNVLTGNIKIKIKPGYTYFWYSKGIINSNTGGYSGMLLDGTFSTFFDDKLVEAGKYNQGLKTGKWTTWYPSGKVKRTCNYKNSFISGEFVIYNENGTLLSRKYFKNGKIKVNKSSPKSKSESSKKSTPKQKMKSKKLNLKAGVKEKSKESPEVNKKNP